MKRNILLFEAVLVVMMLLFACKKEGPQGPAGPQGPMGPTGINTNFNPALYGKWQVVSGMGDTKYLLFKQNNTVTLLDSAQYGFKTLETQMVLGTYSQINFSWMVFNYSISNDTLRLYNLNDSIILKRNNNAPDVSQWVTQLFVKDSIDNPVAMGNGHQDISYDGNYILWLADYNSNTVYKINPLTHSVAGTVTLSSAYSLGSIVYANSYYWITNSGYINKVDPITGGIILTSPSLSSSSIVSLAMVDSDIWFSTWDYEVYTWNVLTNVTNFKFTKDITGMEYYGGYLYMYNEGYIYKCQLSPFYVVQTFYVKHPNLMGISGGMAYDGVNFWVVGYNYYNNTYKIYKIN